MQVEHQRFGVGKVLKVEGVVPNLKARVFFQTVGHVSACVSFSQMAVSFTHVVKAAEPVMSVILAQGILKETYPFYVWAWNFTSTALHR